MSHRMRFNPYKADVNRAKKKQIRPASGQRAPGANPTKGHQTPLRSFWSALNSASFEETRKPWDSRELHEPLRHPTKRSRTRPVQAVTSLEEIHLCLGAAERTRNAGALQLEPYSHLKLRLGNTAQSLQEHYMRV